jgi:cytochrome c biogenesis protein CcmG/thiol:disulfide interchange protein DsbE
LLAVLALVLIGGYPSLALADGDPGSDVLVYQSLFVASDAGVSIRQQVELGDLLQAASRAGFPVRIAIIAHSDDLGSITPLWLKPQLYARFLGYELQLSYRQRLLVVMPNGFGINWPGHSTAAAYQLLASLHVKPGGAGLVAASEAAVQALARGAGVRLTSHATAGAHPRGTAPTPAPARATATAHRHDETTVVVVAVLALLAAVAIAGRRALRRSAGARTLRRLSADPRVRWGMPGGALLVAVLAGAVIVVNLSASTAQTAALARNPYLDPGTQLSRLAPNFTLTDQFGQPVSLDSSRGKVVILDFNDSECTTICPLTTTAMLDAKRMLGAAGSQVELLGVDANPKATSIDDVLSYSQLHGMTNQWRFLTGSLSQLKRVWKAYGVAVDITRGLIAHTPALFIIDGDGQLRRIYITQQSYAAVGQFGQILANEVASLLPGHPTVKSDLSYSTISGISPRTRLAVPRAGGGTVSVGADGSPRLYVFFATWDQEVTSLGGQLDALNRYQSSAAQSGLPALTAVDEGSVEPSASALPHFLSTLPRPLSYPVAIDQNGRLADGYEVQGQPWFVLTSSTGRILWYWQVYSSGWPSRTTLERDVRSALARAPKPASDVLAAERELAHSPPALTAIHQQASQLLDSEQALAARIRALRGYPIVVNAWASWCGPCQAEFSLFASASALYGRKVAFLGADTDDSPGDARSFLTQHPVSYPSYQSSTQQLQGILPGGIEGLPTTIFISPTGKILYIHDGQYDSQGTLDQDITTYALGG